MLTLTDMFDLFLNEFPGLGRGCFALPCILSSAFHGLLFRHTNLP